MNEDERKGRHGTCETKEVRLKNPPEGSDGLATINAEDFDPELHEDLSPAAAGSDEPKSSKRGKK